ncbi:Pvc16 family protein [Trinickia dinghuensis]|nr:Pvc16 family protein [Trinickia dinghuensis]
MGTLIVEPPGVIPRVSKALSALIAAEIGMGQFSDWSITFESPAELDGSGGPRLSLYLYLIKPNAAMRNLAGVVEQSDRSSGGGGIQAQIVPPPSVVDLHYMIVPYSHSAELELEISDCLIRALDRCGVIPEKYLDDGLKKAGNTDMRIAPESATIHTLRDLWSCFPQKMFRLTRLYSVCPVRVPAGVPADTTLVREVRINSPLDSDRL